MALTLDAIAMEYAKQTGCTKEKAHEAACAVACLFAHALNQHALADYFESRMVDFGIADKAQSNRSQWITNLELDIAYFNYVEDKITGGLE